MTSLKAARQGQQPEVEIPAPIPASPPLAKPQTSKAKPKALNPWADLEAAEREPTIRLNLDIPLALNDKLADKARRLRKSKADLVRHLLEWALNDVNE